MGMLFHLASLQYNACVSYATETFSLLEMLVFQLNKEVWLEDGEVTVGGQALITPVLSP